MSTKKTPSENFDDFLDSLLALSINQVHEKMKEKQAPGILDSISRKKFSLIIHLCDDCGADDIIIDTKNYSLYAELVKMNRNLAERVFADHWEIPEAVAMVILASLFPIMR